MIYVYVWTPRDGAWGHSTMYIERRDPAQSRYVSWWPLNYADIDPLGANAADEKTFSEDVALEGQRPNRCFQINLGGEFISEMAMVRAWDDWKTQRTYYTLSRNCCSTVAYLLREPGGGTNYSAWEPVTWWDPNDIVDYMTLLNRHFTVCEPLVPPVPPDIT